MSYANDLEIVSAFAMQDTPPQPQPQTTTKEVVTKEPESMEVDNIDKAISGESKKEEGYESSDLELSSDEEEEEEEESSSDSSSEEEEEEEEKEQAKDNGKKSQILDDEEEVFTDGIVKTVNEIVDIVVEKPTFDVTPQTEIVLAGSIFQIIGNVIVIHCRPGCEYNTLDQGSLLVYENREIMGEVFETFGPVARPYYSVRFNDAKEINMEYGKIGASVFYVPTYQKTQIVETEALKKIKGTDASNIYDEEVGEDEMEFSDDEKEMEFKRKRKNKGKRANNKKNTNDRPMINRHQQPRQARDEGLDFDQMLDAYQSSQLPPRQQQSYADITDYTVPQQQQQQSNYQTPADLVSALFKSYNGQLPTQLPTTNNQSDTPKKSLESIFSKPPPPIE